MWMDRVAGGEEEGEAIRKGESASECFLGGDELKCSEPAWAVLSCLLPPAEPRKERGSPELGNWIR